jgi:fructosamine-3-kinase
MRDTKIRNYMKAKAYNLSPSFNGVVSQVDFFYENILRDQPLDKGQRLADQFNDLYHLFLNKFARLSHDPSFSDEQAQEMKKLLNDLLKVRRELEKS